MKIEITNSEGYKPNREDYKYKNRREVILSNVYSEDEDPVRYISINDYVSIQIMETTGFEIMESELLEDKISKNRKENTPKPNIRINVIESKIKDKNEIIIDKDIDYIIFNESENYRTINFFAYGFRFNVVGVENLEVKTNSTKK